MCLSASRDDWRDQYDVSGGEGGLRGCTWTSWEAPDHGDLTQGLRDEGDQGCGDVETQLEGDKWGLGGCWR